jgi:hypothetical protein
MMGKKKNYLSYYLIIVLLSFIIELKGQILNIDREIGEDTLNKKFHAAFDFNF